MLSAKEAHRLLVQEKIELDLALVAIELKIRKACKNEENGCSIKENEMTDKAYVTLSEEGYQVRWSVTYSGYEVSW